MFQVGAGAGAGIFVSLGAGLFPSLGAGPFYYSEAGEKSTGPRTRIYDKEQIA